MCVFTLTTLNSKHRTSSLIYTPGLRQPRPHSHSHARAHTHTRPHTRAHACARSCRHTRHSVYFRPLLHYSGLHFSPSFRTQAFLKFLRPGSVSRSLQTLSQTSQLARYPPAFSPFYSQQSAPYLEQFSSYLRLKRTLVVMKVMKKRSREEATGSKSLFSRW